MALTDLRKVTWCKRPAVSQETFFTGRNNTWVMQMRLRCSVKAQIARFHASGLNQRQIKNFSDQTDYFFTIPTRVSLTNTHNLCVLLPQTSHPRLHNVCDVVCSIVSTSASNRREINVIICLASLFPMTAHLCDTLYITGSLKEIHAITRGADKSLARPTSRCRNTESIVSMERGACSCAELQVFSCYRGWKEACQATSAIFPARQDAEGNSRHSNRNIRGTCTIVCHWVAQFKRGDFSTCVAPRPGRPKTVTTPGIIDQIHELILLDRRILAKSIAEQLGISRERVGSIILEDLDMRKLSAK